MMKKLGLVLSLLIFPTIITGAEAATGAVQREAGAKQDQASHDALFLHMDRRAFSDTVFDILSWVDGRYLQNAGQRTVTPYVGEVNMAGIQHGAFYYIFIPDRTRNGLLVFKLLENGTIQPNADGSQFTSIPIEAPVSVSPVKDSNDTLLVGVTTQAPSLEVFKLSGNVWRPDKRVSLDIMADTSAAAAASAAEEDTSQPADVEVFMPTPKLGLMQKLRGRMGLGKQWQRGRLFLGDPKDTSAAAAASAAEEYTSQSTVVVDALLHQGKVYFFLVSDKNPQVKVAIMDSSGGIALQDYPELTLPFSTSKKHKGKYSIATGEYNNELYMFVVGTIDRSNGFIYGWKLEKTGRFVPVIEKRVDRLPHDIIINDTPEVLYITVTYFNDFSIQVYRFTGTGFEGPLEDHRVTHLPIKIRKVPYRDNTTIAVLGRGALGGRGYSLREYQIGNKGISEITEKRLPENRIVMPPVDFLFIEGMTKKHLKEILDEATDKQYPSDIVGRIAEFVVKKR